MVSKYLNLFTIILLLIFFGNQSLESQTLRGFSPSKAANQISFEQRLKENIDSETFRSHLYAITSEPHHAGSEASRRVIEYLSEAMESAGLEVTHYNYDVLLDEPGEVKIQLISGSDKKLIPNREYVYEEDPWSAHPELSHGWNAYSGSGDVSAEFVYVNYGTKEDFEKLDSMGMDLDGKIALARYGRNFRGYKARYAEEYGAIGLVIFTDATEGRLDPSETFPHTGFLDHSAIQRGSLITLDYYGDPLTPHGPSLPMDHPDTPERLDIEEVDLPGIPVAPIGSAAAAKILSAMQGEKAPDDWQGGFDLEYKIKSGAEVKLNLIVDQPREIKRITNVIGKIEGSTYPDEWVILGCHHDAWTFGTADPNSGTAMLLTLADALGELMSEGWRPERTMIFAHWDAEEYGLIGATEWVEQMLEELKAKAVAYFNADMTVTGARFGASATPSLHTGIVEASHFVNHPDTSISLFEYWTKDIETGRPPIGRLGSGSDFAPFVLYATVPSAQIGLYGSVPVYHSAFDNLYYYESFLDGEFKYGSALAAYYGVLTTRFANAEIIPYDFHRYAVKWILHLEELEKEFDDVNLSNVNLMNLLALLENQTAFYNEMINDFSEHGIPLIESVEKLNKELIGWERNLFLEEGLPFNPWMQNIFISPDPFQGYAAWVLPAIRYVLLSEDEVVKGEWASIIEKHESAVRQMLLSMHRINDFLYGE